MKVPRNRISAVISSRLAGGENVGQLSAELAAYLLSEKRTGELDSLLRDIQAYRAEQGLVEAEAVSAHPLSAQVRADAEAKVRTVFPEAKQIVITEIIDDSVIGGIRLALPHRQLDLTIRAQLNRFKQLTAAGE
jgi:F0F1-type ATP synthase delta subunit